MRRFSAAAGALLGLFAVAAGDLPAHEFTEQPLTIDCEVARIGATLTRPEHDHDGEAETHEHKHACVVIVGGTLSQTRDGGLLRRNAPRRDALKRLAQAMAGRGYASIRYDKVGFGQSKAKQGWQGTYRSESQLAAAVIERARQLDHIEQVVVAGESAGGYLACLAAQNDCQADAYVFLGAHCGSGPDIYAYNFARLARLADEDAEWKELAQERLRFELALGRSYDAMFAAAARGEPSFEMAVGDAVRKVPLARRREELKMPPDEMFRFIKAPVLAVSGQYDLNVPPEHAARIVSMLRNAGNHRCTCVMIPGCDHSFQIGPPDEETRLRERYTLDSFKRPYSPQLYRTVADWLDDTLGYAPSSQLPASVEDAPSVPQRAAEGAELEPKTDATPERLHLAPGIQIVNDITDKRQTTGVETLEGQIGPLLLGQGCQAHFIDMPAGMYCEEHPHSKESVIYTVRGKWVLCSNGRRHVMQPGSLFHFAANTPTGYEVPFAEDAFILIFKGERLTKQEADFISYLKGMAQRLQREHQAGVPYLLSDLPPDHAAIQFARQVNPDYGKEAATGR